MSAPDDRDRHALYRSSYRADVAPLHDALHSPSPLGNILDNLHRSQRSLRNLGNSNRDGDNCDVDVVPYNLGPGSNHNDDSHGTKSDYTIFGAGSIASSAVATVVGGVHNTIAHWKVLIFGQLISFFLAAAGAASEELNGTCRVSVPLTQTALVGGLLMLLGAVKMKGWCAGCCLRWRGASKRTGDSNDEEDNFFGGRDDDGEDQSSIRSPLNDDGDSTAFGDDRIDGWVTVDDERPASPVARSRGSSHPHSFCWGLQTVHAPWWAYLAVGLVAVEGRYLVFLSFRYTSFTFIYMMNALAIPSAMVFSKFLLGRQYQMTHVLGGIVCVTGIAVSTISDLQGKADPEKVGSRSDIDPLEHLKGDVLAIIGSVLLGLDDVLSELMIKNYGGVDELLCMKWLFGFIISVVQLAFLERDSMAALFESQGGEPCDVSTRFLLLSIYVLFQVLDIAGELRFLVISEAALLNLSLLTSDLWAAAFSILAVGVALSGLYYVALLLIVAGIVLYEAGPSPLSHSTPSDIKITIRGSKTEHTADLMKDEKMEGHFEMT